MVSYFRGRFGVYQVINCDSGKKTQKINLYEIPVINTGVFALKMIISVL